MTTHIYPKGRCCEGSLCKHLDHELRPAHTCQKCKEIVHLLCGQENLLTDEICCNKCFASSEANKETAITDIVIEPTNNNCLISTITLDENYELISKEYFITKDQKLNTELQGKYGEKWYDLKRKVNKQIDNTLKLMMILKSQEIGLSFSKGNGEDSRTIIQTFNDIGSAWKCDASHEQATKINEVMHGSFDGGYEFYMEANIMKELKIKYEDSITTATKGCIARMIVNRKCVLTKLINKRSEISHQRKIITKRTVALPEGTKKVKSTFHVSSNGKGENVWFMRDGSVCDGSTIVVPNEVNTQFYLDRIKGLEDQLATKMKVTTLVNMCYCF